MTFDILNMVNIIVSVIGSATLIFRGLIILTKFTKTNRDDEIIGKILKVFEHLSLNTSKIKDVLIIKVVK